MFQVMAGLTPSRPGLVGISLDLPAAGPRRSDRVRLRHGYLERRSPDTLTVSGPPSPGLDSAVTRMAEDLTAAGLATSAVTRIRVGLEAGLDDESLLGMRHRWAVANAAVPVLAASFAARNPAVPVAARGHLVLSVDASPGSGWQVPAAVVVAVLEDPAAGLEALDETPGHPSGRLFAAAYAALARQGLPRPLRDAVGDFCDRYVFRDRSPADDVPDIRP